MEQFWITEKLMIVCFVFILFSTPTRAMYLFLKGLSYIARKSSGLWELLKMTKEKKKECLPQRN